MPERLIFLVIICVLTGGRGFLRAQESRLSREQRETRWYRSNSAGMTLEYTSSRVAALRNEYSLSIETPEPGGVPEILLPHYDASFGVELRTLYENSNAIRRQWIFRDENETVRLSASGSDILFDSGGGAAVIIPGKVEIDGEGNSAGDSTVTADDVDTGADVSGADVPGAASRDAPPERVEKRTGFIEIRNGDGALTRELRFEDDLSEWDFRFNYNEKVLVSAETLFKAPPAPAVSEDGTEETETTEIAEKNEIPPEENDFVPVSTDYYRYSRSGSLRAIDRALHEGGSALSRLGFPRLGTGFSEDDELVNYGIVYTSEFLRDIHAPEGSHVTYSLDSRGRVLGEVWKNENEETAGEFTNIWSGDRLVSMRWKSDNDERLVEYEYDDSGNRVMERDYKSGELERTVKSVDGKDMEEIYKDGRLMLRAIWENGRKISEEWITGGGKGR